MNNQTRIRPNRLWLICALLTPVTDSVQSFAPSFSRFCLSISRNRNIAKDCPAGKRECSASSIEMSVTRLKKGPKMMTEMVRAARANAKAMEGGFHKESVKTAFRATLATAHPGSLAICSHID
jgi:hypothetical protein